MLFLWWQDDVVMAPSLAEVHLPAAVHAGQAGPTSLLRLRAFIIVRPLANTNKSEYMSSHLTSPSRLLHQPKRMNSFGAIPGLPKAIP